ncbi:hypothetical protein NDU88_001838 [Pleurodeles waltl]|uniref:Uncharacterized protein n=1 Tax=Pleurodeles waltl TaxID=8319 RepID=A0AAV7TK27_PLEWA|nr:hypothetical protein NDU88_001838 [Pleurodeles waltl]
MQRENQGGTSDSSILPPQNKKRMVTLTQETLSLWYCVDALLLGPEASYKKTEMTEGARRTLTGCSTGYQVSI